MEEIAIKQRMYFLVPYNISEIQKGIQALHAVVEYSQRYFLTSEYQAWAQTDKTVILLNGGTMNDETGTITQHLAELNANQIRLAVFREPDLNNAISSVAFLVDERVYDQKKYPLPEEPQPSFVYLTFPAKLAPVSEEDVEQHKKECLQILGSQQNVFLREFLKKFRLA